MFIVKKISIFPVKTMAVATSTQDLNLVELKGLLICIDIIQFRTLLFHITDAQDTTSSLLGDIYLAIYILPPHPTNHPIIIKYII